MSRRIDPAFQEVLCAALLVFLPAHREASLSQRQALRRLEKAIALPRGVMEGWPSECCDLVIRAQLTIDGHLAGAKPNEISGGIDKASIEAATDAKWPVRHAWQRRRDIGDDIEVAA